MTISSLVTTTIPYVNAVPHLGFAYELVLADVLARHRRRRGHDVRLLAGTDDHSLKNVRAAALAGSSPRAFVDHHAGAFAALGPLLDVAPDDFVRTSRDPRHAPGVAWLWRACAARGDLYKRAWEGWYCAGCETFVDDDAVCPEHGTAPEPVREDNWFFRLARWAEPVREAIETGQLRIVPDAARAETLAFLAGDVRDLSVSRDAARADGWGIPVPGDPSQVVWVWFDALAYYLTALGLGGDDAALLDRYWRAGERAHVVGKGVTRFHAVYWPAFLLSAGLPLPGTIYVHGYLTVDGEKIRKSGGTPVGVPPLVGRYGADALRWYFVRRCRTRSDADVPLASLAAAHDAELADRLGNLVQRTVALAGRLCGGRVPERGEPGELALLGDALPARVDAALAAFLPDEAAGAILELVDAANRELDRSAPWRTRDATALYAPLEAARRAASELQPFVPGVAQAIANRLGDAPLEPGAPLVAGPPPVPKRGATS